MLNLTTANGSAACECVQDAVVREFFLPPPSAEIAWPPQTTAQVREVGVRANGKPFFYKPARLQRAEAHLKNALARHVPVKPIRNRPIRLVVKWLFPFTKGHHNGEYKLTRPDTDNLQKLLKDCMTDLGYWVDDSLVCSEIIEKFWADTPGIYIRIEVMEG